MVMFSSITICKENEAKDTKIDKTSYLVSVFIPSHKNLEDLIGISIIMSLSLLQI